MASQLEAHLARDIKVTKLPAPEAEYKFSETRKWRIDFAWPEHKIAVECEGGVWTQGDHVRPKRFISDCEKYNALAELGWRVFRFPENMIYEGSAIQQLQRVFGKVAANGAAQAADQGRWFGS